MFLGNVMRTSHVLDGVECSQSLEDKTNFPAFWKFPADDKVVTQTPTSQDNKNSDIVGGNLKLCTRQYSLRTTSTIYFIHAWIPRAFRVRTCYQTRLSLFYVNIINYTMHLNETFRFCYDYMYIFLINTIPSSPLSPLNTSFAVVFAAKKTNKSNDLLKA